MSVSRPTNAAHCSTDCSLISEYSRRFTATVAEHGDGVEARDALGWLPDVHQCCAKQLNPMHACCSEKVASWMSSTGNDGNRAVQHVVYGLPSVMCESAAAAAWG